MKTLSEITKGFKPPMHSGKRRYPLKSKGTDNSSNNDESDDYKEHKKLSKAHPNTKTREYHGTVSREIEDMYRETSEGPWESIPDDYVNHSKQRLRNLPIKEANHDSDEEFAHDKKRYHLLKNKVEYHEELLRLHNIYNPHDPNFETVTGYHKENLQKTKDELAAHIKTMKIKYIREDLEESFATDKETVKRIKEEIGHHEEMIRRLVKKGFAKGVGIPFHREKIEEKKEELRQHMDKIRKRHIVKEARITPRTPDPKNAHRPSAKKPGSKPTKPEEYKTDLKKAAEEGPEDETHSHRYWSDKFKIRSRAVRRKENDPDNVDNTDFEDLKRVTKKTGDIVKDYNKTKSVKEDVDMPTILRKNVDHHKLMIRHFSSLPGVLNSRMAIKHKQKLADAEKAQHDYLKEDNEYPGRKEHPKDPPPTILLKRKAIRVFPNGKRVAMYYAQTIDRYISIPYDVNNFQSEPSVPGISESVLQEAKVSMHDYAKALKTGYEQHMKWHEDAKAEKRFKDAEYHHDTAQKMKKEYHIALSKLNESIEIIIEATTKTKAKSKKKSGMAVSGGISNLSKLGQIANEKNTGMLKFEKGGSIRVDTITAKALLKVHGMSNDENKIKFERAINKSLDSFRRAAAFSHGYHAAHPDKNSPSNKSKKK